MLGAVKLGEHLTGQSARKTTVTYEFPTAEGDPYYPVPRPENQAFYKRYEALALATPDVHFVGRLATFRRIAEREARAVTSATSAAVAGA